MNPSSMLRRFMMAVPIALTCGHAAAQAGPPAPAVPSIDAAQRAAIVDWVAEHLKRSYVLPDVADRMEASLRTRLEDGTWDGRTDTRSFVEAVSRDLEAVSGDRHIGLRYAPEPTSRAVRADPDEEARRREAMERNLQYSNFMFQKAEYLDGNVGYLRFDRFYDPRLAGPTVIAALEFLAHTDALILDLRQNAGGHAGMIRLMLGYFFAEPTHINSWYDREADATVQSWTPDHVPGTRLVDTDLYVLTSPTTFSAAEELAYDLQSRGRATIVGEVTGGGGHTVQLVRNDELGLELRVPNGRAINPVTGTGWEGTGVNPNVAAPAAAALDVAYALALKRLAETQPEGSSRGRYLAWIAQYQGARGSPAPLPASEVLERYAGQYGPIEIQAHDGGLFFLGPGVGEETALMRLDRTTYIIDGIADIRIEFEVAPDGTAAALYGVFFDGRRDRFPKER